MLATFGEWLALAPLWVIGLAIFCGLTGAALIAGGLRRYQNRKQAPGESTAEASEEAVAITSVLGLLALLIAFTFSIALDRFDTRRANVLQESNAIGTTYLRAQLLEEPHRSPHQQIAGRLYRYEGCTRDGSTGSGATCAAERRATS